MSYSQITTLTFEGISIENPTNFLGDLAAFPSLERLTIVGCSLRFNTPYQGTPTSAAWRFNLDRLSDRLKLLDLCVRRVVPQRTKGNICSRDCHRSNTTSTFLS